MKYCDAIRSFKDIEPSSYARACVVMLLEEIERLFGDAYSGSFSDIQVMSGYADRNEPENAARANFEYRGVQFVWRKRPTDSGLRTNQRRSDDETAAWFDSCLARIRQIKDYRDSH